jgi:16S rRNA (guanine1207-N2)-methyltransferase
VQTTYDVDICGVSLALATAPRLFSPRGLDAGSRFLLETVSLGEDERVCDLGCGYGPVGICVAKRIGAERVVMIDQDRAAVDLALANAAHNEVPGVTVIEADGFANVDEAGFTWILCNPPYHVDWAVPKRFIRKGFNRLRIGGKMALVVKRRDWYETQLKAVFGGSTCHERDGYHVLIAERRRAQWAS